jgi:proline iminopeptidase
MRRDTQLDEIVVQSDGEVKAAAEREKFELGTKADLSDPGLATEIINTVWTVGFAVNYMVNRTLGADAARVFEVDAISPRIRRLLTPTLCIHGEADPRPLWSVQALAELLPNAQVTVIPNAGHYPWFEQHELFREAVRSFLSTVS